MGYALICGGAALSGYIIGLLMGKRCSEQKIYEMRSQMGLDVETGEEIENEPFKE